MVVSWFFDERVCVVHCGGRGNRRLRVALDTPAATAIGCMTGLGRAVSFGRQRRRFGPGLPAALAAPSPVTSGRRGRPLLASATSQF